MTPRSHRSPEDAKPAPAPSRSWPTSLSSAARSCSSTVPAASLTAVAKGARSIQPSISTPARRTDGSASTFPRPSTTPPAAGSTTASELTGRSIASRSTTPGPPAVQRRSRRARAGRARRPPHRDATVLRLCREGLRPGRWFATLTDSALGPHPAAAAFVCGLILFVTRRGGLNALERDLRIPGGCAAGGPSAPERSTPSAGSMPAWAARRCGPTSPTSPTGSSGTSALSGIEGRYVAAVDGHEFFSSRKRCCPQCQTRTLTIDGQPVTEYDHQGVVCHLVGEDLCWPWTSSCSGPARGSRPPPCGCWSGFSPLTRGSSTWWWPTPCTSMRRLSTSASTGTST